MPDVLVLCAEPSRTLELGKLCEESSLRVKSTTDLKTAIEWVKLKPFDLLILDSGAASTDRKDLEELLWSENPGALLIAYDPEGTIKNPGEIRLAGAEVLSGPNAMKLLKELSSRLASRKPLGGDRFRVLVVEDLDSPRDIICSYIEGLGYGSVRGVGSVKEALQLLESDPGYFSAVITDIRMPENSGMELIEQIRRHPKLQHLPVTVLTAYGTIDHLVECLAAGASGFLVKPPKRGDLVREIGRAIRISRHELNPRITTREEINVLREALLRRGYS